MGASSRSHRLLLALPVTLLLQRVGDLAWHVGLVVLGQHRVGLEHARPIKHAFGDHALSFPEQVRQEAPVLHAHGPVRVHDLEGDILTQRAADAAFLDEAAEAEPGARLDALLGYRRGRVEEHDAVAHGVEHQPEGDREHAERRSDEGKPALLAGHGLRSSEESARSPASASMPAIAVWSGESAARALAGGAAALSRSPSRE